MGLLRSLMLVGMLGWVCLAPAAPPVPATGTPPRLAACQSVVRAGDRPAARRCLTRVHAADPRSGALCHLGRMELAAAALVEAYEAYQRCLGESGGKLAPAELRRARRQLTTLRGQLAFLFLRVTPPGARLFIDGRERPGALRRGAAVQPGNRRVRLEAAGHQTWRDLLTLTAGEEVVREVRLEPLPVRSVRRRPPAKQPAPPKKQGPAMVVESLEAEVLLARAVAADRSRASRRARATAWCRLALVAPDNPHRPRARRRCRALWPEGEKHVQLLEELPRQRQVLLDYLALSGKGEAHQLGAITSFLKRYRRLQGTPTYDAAALAALAGVSPRVRRLVCAAEGATSLPRIAVTFDVTSGSGSALAGKAFADGVLLGRVPGTHHVSPCAEKIGVSEVAGGAWWEQSVPLTGKPAVTVRVVFSRYAVLAGVVHDWSTRRTWQAQVAPEQVTGSAAHRICRELQLQGGGWRLPSRAELESLVVRGATPSIEGSAFPQTPAAAFWTATPHPTNRYHSWVVDFRTGGVTGRFVAKRAYVRCVR